MNSVKGFLQSGGLGLSLANLPDVDRLFAAWIVVCGRILAEHGEILSYSDGQLVIVVEAGAWMEQFRSIRAELEVELARVAGLPVTGIHFQVKR